jgi:hypothetical protein
MPDMYAYLRAALARIGPADLPIANGFEEIGQALTLADPSGWNDIVPGCDYHGATLLLEPIIAATCRQVPERIPDQARRGFFALASRHRQRAAAREECVDQLLAGFAGAGMTGILLKGSALAHRIYPRPDLRPMVDIDILIDPADQAAAVAACKRLGYVFAERHPTIFTGRIHHLPGATLIHSGFEIFLELHTDTMSPNQPNRLNIANLSAPPVAFRRGSGPDGLALGHSDMLRHLIRHAFEPARQIRLIHLYDIWRYQEIFAGEIDWQEITTRFPFVPVALRLICQVFEGAGNVSQPEQARDEPHPAGVGHGMIPLSEIAASRMRMAEKLSAVFNPPAWWLHGFYGVPLDRSLLLCKTVKHPATVARWLMSRATAAAGLRSEEGFT